MQVVRDALCMRGGSKDRALVVLEHGKPVRDVARVIGWVPEDGFMKLVIRLIG